VDMYSAQLEQEHFNDVIADLQFVFSSPNPLYELLHQKVLASPTRCAVTDGVISFSYAELFQRVLACAQQLAAHGVSARARVALYAANTPVFFAWYHALHAVGAIIMLVPVSLHEREVARIFEKGRPSVIIAEPAKMELVVACNEMLRAIPVIDVDSDVIPTNEELDLGVQGRMLEDVAVVLYTSGSTGDPRGVALSVKNILTNAAQSLVRMCRLGLDDDGERFLAVLPLTHAFGHMTCLWLPLIAGATVFVMPGIKRKELLAAFSSFEPTAFFMVPALVGLLCTMYSLQVDSVKAFVSGGDFLSSKLAAGFELLFGRRICSGYGLSEASPVVGINVYPRASTSSLISPLLVGIEYKITPSVSDSSPAVGELMIRSDSVFQGYLEDPDMPLRTTLIDGWLPTGDLVEELADRSLNMIGRCKDVIVFKAFNVYPQEVERVLLLHPHVYMAVVIGLEHELFGQTPVAAVVVKPGATVEEKALVSLCKEHLASYKIPHKIVIYDQLPLNHLGKIDRRTVKKMIEG